MNLASVPLQAVRPNTHHHHLPPIPVVLQKAQTLRKDMCLFTLSKHLLTKAKIIAQAPCSAQGLLHEPKPSGPPRSVVSDMERQ